MLSKVKVLVYSYTFSQNASSLYSRIYDEYSTLSKFVKLSVIAEDISDKENNNLFLYKVAKISGPIIHVIFRTLAFFFGSIHIQKNYSVIYLRVLDLAYMPVCIMLKKILKKKLVLWISNAETGHEGTRRKIYRYLYKKIFSMADAIFCSSNDDIITVEKYLNKKLDSKKIIVIKPGVNTTRFKPKKIQNDENVLLCVARVLPIKLIENLIEIIPLIKKSIPDVILKIVGPIGDEIYHQKLRSLSQKLECQENVEFVGPVPYQKLVDYYNSSKIFLQPTESAGTSTVTFEAMACGIPVIVAPAGARLELIENGVTGFLIDNKNPQTLADKVVELLNNESYREKIGMEARKMVEEKLNFEKHIETLANLLNEVDDSK